MFFYQIRFFLIGNLNIVGICGDITVWGNLACFLFITVFIDDVMILLWDAAAF